jgi:hypothetical protein
MPTQASVQWVPGDLSPGIKRLEREVDHSSSSAEIKNAWRFISTTPIRLQGVVLI